MSEIFHSIRGILADLESLQRQAGELQLGLLRIVTDERQDEWDEPAQEALLKLETVQRTVGEAQVVLVRRIPTSGPLPCDSEELFPSLPQDEVKVPSPGKEPDATEPGAIGPIKWLDEHSIRVKSIAPLTGLDETADRAALFLGDRFERLADFYRTVKRRVEGRTKVRWYPAADLPAAVISDICLFGTQLLGSGFFTTFRYFKRGTRSDENRKPVVLFDPLEDARVRYFFSGGWLERYVFQIVRSEICEAYGSWKDEYFEKGVRVELPNGRDAEFDVLVGLPCNEMLWIECKSGEWQSSIPRLRDLGKRFLGLSSMRALLVVVGPLTPEQQSSAETLTGMSVVTIAGLRGWINQMVSQK
jgi:hypothetical protein